MFDQSISVKKQITSLCQSTNFHLPNIGQIRKYLDIDATSALNHSLITSCLDNNKALLAGAPKCNTDRLEITKYGSSNYYSY